MQKQVVVINKELQESGKELARKCEDLMQCRLQQRNIASAIDQLSMCLPVLHTYAKMQDQMEAGRLVDSNIYALILNIHIYIYIYICMVWYVFLYGRFEMAIIVVI